MYRAEVGLAYQDQVIQALTQALQQQQAGQDPAQALAFAKQAFDEAERQMKATIAFVPDEYDNYVFLANLYNLGGQYFQDDTYYEKARATAEQGIQVERYGPAIRYQHASALWRLKQNDKAIDELEYALEMDPRFSDAVVLLSNILQEEGKTGEAKAVLEDFVAKEAALGVEAPPSVTSALQSLTTSATTTAP